METPDIIAATLKRKLNLEGSEVLVDSEPTEQKTERSEELAVPPSTTSTVAAPSSSWFDWLPSLNYFSGNPSSLTEEEQIQKEQQIKAGADLAAAVARAQESEDDDYILIKTPLVETHLLSTAIMQQQEQELKAKEEVARALEEERLRQEQELKAQEEAARVLEAQRLQHEQELKTQQEAPETASTIWNLYGLLSSSSSASPSQSEPAAIVADSTSANASHTPTPGIVADDSYLSYIFGSAPRSSAAPIDPLDPHLDPHPAAELAMQTADEAVTQLTADEVVAHLSTNATLPALTVTPPATPEPTGTQTGETKEENEDAVFDAAADALLETKLSEEAIQAEERIRMEAEALQAARIRMEEEQAQRERDEKARQDVLRAAAEEQTRIRREAEVREAAQKLAEEQARIAREQIARQAEALQLAAAQQAREERARQDALREAEEARRREAEARATAAQLQIQQEQQAAMLLQQQTEVRRLQQQQERQRAAQVQAAEEKRKAEETFARSCSTGAPTLEEHYRRAHVLRNLIG